MNKLEQTPTPEELNNLENDAVWTLLNEASTRKASPAFAASLMEKIQSEDVSETSEKVIAHPSFWKRYSLPLGGAAAAGIAACIMLAFNTNTEHKPGDNGQSMANQLAGTELELTDMDLELLAQEEAFPLDELATANTEIDQFTDEMIAIEDDDPFFMSADEIQVLVSM